MLRLIAQRLPQFPLDLGFRQGLPKELAGMLEPEASSGPTEPIMVAGGTGF